MDEIEVHATDEHGCHIVRHVVGDPPATDRTVIATAELAALRAELEQLRLTARVNYGLYRSAHEDAEQAEAEAARLRAGESDQPAAEAVCPTPAEWIHRWNRTTADERLARVEQIRRDADTAFRCQQQDHETVLQELANALQIIARVRALHRDAHGEGICAECSGYYSVTWPCDTARALNGETS